MKSTPYAMFGYVALIVDVVPSDGWKDITLSEEGLVTSGLYYYTKGVAKVRVKETNEQLADRTPGWLNIEHPDQAASTPGTLDLTFPEDTQWVCISNQYNPNGLPNLQSLVVNSGQQVSLANNSNIFLVSGELTINDRKFTGPGRIRIRSGDVVATAGDSTCYALKMIPKV
jgi:hypothetical protein